MDIIRLSPRRLFPMECSTGSKAIMRSRTTSSGTIPKCSNRTGPEPKWRCSVSVTITAILYQASGLLFFLYISKMRAASSLSGLLTVDSFFHFYNIILMTFLIPAAVVGPPFF